MPALSQQAALAAAVALVPDRGCERERAGARTRRSRGVRTGAVAPAARDDAQGRFRRGEAVGFLEEEVVAWGEPASDAAHGARRARRRRGADQRARGRRRARSPPQSRRRLDGRPGDAELEQRHGGQPAYWWLLAAECARASRRRGAHHGMGPRDPCSRGVRLRSPHRALRRLARTAGPRAAAARRCAAASLALQTRSRAHRQARRRAADARHRHASATLLEHLPRERREARTVAELSPASRRPSRSRCARSRRAPVRRRGDAPARGGDRVRRQRLDAAAFFNQPWLVDRYAPGTRLLLHGKRDGRGAASRCVTTRSRRTASCAGAGGEARREVAHYPATRGNQLDADAALVRRARAALARGAEPLPGALRARRAAARPRGRARGDALPARPRGGARRARRRLAFEELLLTPAGAAAPPRAARQRTGRRSRAAPSSPQRWLSERLPFALDRRPARGDARRSTPTWRGRGRCSAC